MTPKLRELIRAWLEHVRGKDISNPDIADVRNFLNDQGYSSDSIEKAVSATASSKNQSKGDVKLPRGVKQASDGNYYKWLGQQWAKYNPNTGNTSQMAKRDVAQELGDPREPPEDLPDDVKQASDGNFYKWLGQQWALYDPDTGKTSQMAKRDIAKELGNPNEDPEDEAPEDEAPEDEEDKELTFPELDPDEQELYAEISKVVKQFSGGQRRQLARMLKDESY